MKEIRSITLLRTLTDKELSRFEKTLSEHKRNSLLPLYKELSKLLRSSQKEFDKEKTFKKVFGKNYKADLDYLMRNELRLLNEEVYSFLMEEMRTRELKNKETLRHSVELKMLFERKLFDEFDEKFQGYYDAAMKHMEFGSAGEMGRLLFLRTVDFNKHDNVEQLSETGKLIQEKMIDNSWRDAMRKFRNFQSHLGYVSYRLRALNIEAGLKTDFFEQAKFDLSKYETTISSQFYHGFLYFAETNPEKKLAAAEQVLKDIETISEATDADGEKVYHNEIQKWLMHVGNQLTALGRKKEALKCFERVCEMQPEKLATHSHAIQLHNYTICLFQNELFTKCESVLEEHREFIFAHEIVRKGALFRLLLCYAALNKVNLIRENIPQQYASLDTEEYCCYRAVLSIVFYLENETGQALREGENLLVRLKNREVENYYTDIWKIYVRHFEVLQQYGNEKTKLKHQLEKLLKQTDDAMHKHGSTDTVFLTFLNWLVFELKKKLEL